MIKILYLEILILPDLFRLRLFYYVYFSCNPKFAPG